MDRGESRLYFNISAGERRVLYGLSQKQPDGGKGAASLPRAPTCLFLFCLLSHVQLQTEAITVDNCGVSPLCDRTLPIGWWSMF